MKKRPLDSKPHNLSSTENPFGPPAYALKGTVGRLRELHQYPPDDDAPLRAALARAQPTLQADQFLTANGSLGLIDLICRALLAPGDQVIVSTPTIPAYADFARLAGAGVIDIPLDHQFDLDIPALLRASNEKTRLLFISSPNNPSGAIVSSADMDRLMNALPPHVTVVYDEAYHQYATDPGYARALDYIRKGLPVIGLHSFSKAHGLAGIRLGYAFSTLAIVRRLSQLRLPFLVNSFSMATGIAALANPAFVQKTVRSATKEKKWFYRTFEHMGLRFWISHAPFILLRTPYDPAYLAKQLQDKGILVRPGTVFGAKDCIRITVGKRPANKGFIRVLSALVEHKYI